jgi:hypothetical protein
MRCLLASVLGPLAVLGHCDYHFGIGDADVTPAGGWTLMTPADLVAHADDITESYNSEGGIRLVTLAVIQKR